MTTTKIAVPGDVLWGRDMKKINIYRYQNGHESALEETAPVISGIQISAFRLV